MEGEDDHEWRIDKYFELRGRVLVQRQFQHSPGETEAAMKELTGKPTVRPTFGQGH